MSSDQERGAPSFGDLFDDPDSPETSDGTSRASVPAAPEPRPTDRPALVGTHDEASAETTHGHAEDPAPLADDLVTGHDLDHESDEASHLVAGFEHADDSDSDTAEGSDAAGSDGSDGGSPSGYDSVMIAPLSDVMRAHPEVDSAAPADRAVTVAPLAAGLATAAPGSAAAGHAWDGVVDPAISSAPANRVDTGRLYRSSGAEGPATLDAIPAIDPDYRPANRIEAVATPTTSARSGSLTYTGVAVVVIATTVIVAFAEALLRKEIGVLTGVALLASSVYAALVVRRADIWAAVVMPPLAFLVATLTAGQLTQTRTGAFLLDQGSLLLLVLGKNALWVIGTSLVCLVIVLVRRRRA